MMVDVVRQGPYKSWFPGQIVYEGKSVNDCMEFIHKNLYKYKKLYVDRVRKEKLK